MFSLLRRSVRFMSEAAAVSAKPVPSEKVFVKNISFDSSLHEVQEAFTSLGLKPLSQSFPMMRQNESLHRGFGWIEFASKDEAAEAVQKINGLEVKGRALMAKFHEALEPSTFSRNTEAQSPSTTLYVGRIPKTATFLEVRKIFESYGSAIKAIRIGKDHVTQEPKGYAHIQFQSVEDATKALEEQKGAVLQGQELRMDFAQERN